MSKTKRLLKRLAAERGYTLVRIVDEVEGRDIAPHRAGAASVPRALRLRCPRSSAAGTVSLHGSGDPLLLVHRPAAVRFLHLWLGYMHPTKSVSLTDVHRCSPSLYPPSNLCQKPFERSAFSSSHNRRVPSWSTILS
jgi:hypothetical protein